MNIYSLTDSILSTYKFRLISVVSFSIFLFVLILQHLRYTGIYLRYTPPLTPIKGSSTIRTVHERYITYQSRWSSIYENKVLAFSTQIHEVSAHLNLKWIMSPTILMKFKGLKIIHLENDPFPSLSLDHPFPHTHHVSCLEWDLRSWQVCPMLLM